MVDPDAFASCPACLVVDGTMTNAALAAGGEWRCQRCGQLWDKTRIAIAVAYARWESRRARPLAGHD